MKIIKKFFRYLKPETFRILYYSIFFNFRVLPFKQAIKLPFISYVRVYVITNNNLVVENLRTGMIRIGKQRSPIHSPSRINWNNKGTVVFKGKCLLGHTMMIQTGKEGYLEFGNMSAFNCGCNISCEKKIIFKERCKISWDCQFYDTDFHPMLDIERNTITKMDSPIIIGENVWIGHNVIVSKGVKLANEVIVSSGSVVKTSCKFPNVILMGNPAQIIDEGYKPNFEVIKF